VRIGVGRKSTKNLHKDLVATKLCILT